MMINQTALLADPPIKEMELGKRRLNGVSYGLSELGYDIRLKQDIHFGTFPDGMYHRIDDSDWIKGRFCLASAIEEFQMPDNLGGIVHDKSTWARHGLSVFNTVIEPGWEGFLTLELVYHGERDLHLSAGTGIAQVIFHRIAQPVLYRGAYQFQEDGPVPSLVPAL